MILDYFKQQSYSAIISEEEASNRHFHILLGTDCDFSNVKVRSPKLYKPLYDLMNTPQEYRKGNVIFRWDGIFRDNYGIYTLKDGDYLCTDDMVDTAFYWQTLSYPKPLGLKKDKALYLQKFHDDSTPFPQLVQSFYSGLCDIYEKYDTAYNYSKIDDIVLMARNKKHQDLRDKDIQQRVKKFL